MPRTGQTLFPRSASPVLRALDLVALLERLCEWHERAMQRRLLMTLDDRMLSDVGLSRAEVEAEYRKPPWRR